jgi:hypothetical protein
LSSEDSVKLAYTNIGCRVLSSSGPNQYKALCLGS